MADNRLFFVHVPTGIAVPIAKKYGGGKWFGFSETLAEDIEKLFDRVYEDGGDGDADDFAIAIENNYGHGKYMTDEWIYGKSEKQFVILDILK